MSEEQLEAIRKAAQAAVLEALAAQPVLTRADALVLVRATLHETFISLGADPTKPLEMQRDFQHLRAWRESIDTVKTRTLWAAVTVIVTGGLGLLWLGLTAKLGFGGK